MIVDCLQNIGDSTSGGSANGFPGAADIYTDDLLVQQTKAGDLQAFDNLMEQYERKIFRIVLRITRHHEDAEDAVQETFLRAYRNIEQFQSRSKFNTWLTSIAINQALICLRKRRGYARYIEQAVQTDDGFLCWDSLDWRPNPEQQCRQSEVAEYLRESVNRLPQPLRAVFVLRHVYEFTMEEAASALGITVDAAKTRVFRARVHLRKRLRASLLDIYGQAH